MDILTHTISGLVVGTVIAGYSKQSTIHRTGIILFSGFAGALPDIDAISLWGGFDSSFGECFNLLLSGKQIYSGKLWYSHHGFFHSLFAAIFFTVLISIFSFLIQKRFKQFKSNTLLESILINKLFLIGFFLAYVIHLLEDMPTPAASWGGVNFLWPIDIYTGGTGQIWWWNNYDIFLIVCAVFIINLLLLFFKKYINKVFNIITIGVFFIGFSFAVIQINSRNYSFAYTGSSRNYYEFETKSKEIQKSVLGSKIYNIMDRFDKKLNIYF